MHIERKELDKDEIDVAGWPRVTVDSPSVYHQDPIRSAYTYQNIKYIAELSEGGVCDVMDGRRKAT